jgi:hypothetical protein
VVSLDIKHGLRIRNYGNDLLSMANDAHVAHDGVRLQVVELGYHFGVEVLEGSTVPVSAAKNRDPTQARLRTFQ